MGRAIIMYPTDVVGARRRKSREAKKNFQKPLDSRSQVWYNGYSQEGEASRRARANKRYSPEKFSKEILKTLLTIDQKYGIM